MLKNITFTKVGNFFTAHIGSGRVLNSRQRGGGFEPHRRHCVVSLSKNINPSLVLVQPRKTCPFKIKRLLMGRKESNQTNKNRAHNFLHLCDQKPHSNALIHMACFSCIIFKVFANAPIVDTVWYMPFPMS